MGNSVTINTGDEFILTFSGKQAAFYVSAAGYSALWPEEQEFTLIRKDKKQLDMPVEIIINIKNVE